VLSFKGELQQGPPQVTPVDSGPLLEDSRGLVASQPKV
jgi:hypothetical protein